MSSAVSAVSGVAGYSGRSWGGPGVWGAHFCHPNWSLELVGGSGTLRGQSVRDVARAVSHGGGCGHGRGLDCGHGCGLRCGRGFAGETMQVWTGLAAKWVWL